MPSWVSALAISILVVVIPFTLILKLMLQLPKPVALSHRRRPGPRTFIYAAQSISSGALRSREAAIVALCPVCRYDKSRTGLRRIHGTASWIRHYPQRDL